MVSQFVSKKPLYNINLVHQATGIKADTLRAWERRYQLPRPERTKGGHRLFSDFDIEIIKWLMDRQKEGMSISRAAQLWFEIENNGEDPLTSSPTGPLPEPLPVQAGQERESLANMQNRWIRACLNFDESSAEQVITQSFAQFSMETVCIDILRFGLAKVGSLWYQGEVSVQQEHFTSELAIRRLHSLISAAPNPYLEETILVGCPRDENHTFSALLTTLLLRYRGWNVIYLGGNVPKGQLKETIEKTKPDLIVMISMRLVTAATLLDTALFLKGFGIPLAFGGWIFTNTPDLRQKIPGVYLGEDLLGSISMIEYLLSGPTPPIEFELEPYRFATNIAHFLEKKHLIEIQTLKKLKEQLDPSIPWEYFQEANDYLAQDIIAALSLGDLSLVGSNMEWVERLISNHDIAGELLLDYLLAYRDAAQTNLDEHGLAIIDWLTSMIMVKS